MTGTPNESAIRRKAKRHGYFVTKSRERKHVPHSNNFGEFMLIETQYTASSRLELQRIIRGHRGFS